MFYPPLIITVYDIKFCAIKNSILSLIAETRRHNRNSITSPRQMIESHPPPHLHTCCWHSFTTGKIWLYCYTELSINSDKHVSIMVTPIPSHVLSTTYRHIDQFQMSVVHCTMQPIVSFPCFLPVQMIILILLYLSVSAPAAEPATHAATADPINNI